MEYIILGLLLFKDMTIYELNSNFKKGLSMIYSASYGSLQNATKKALKAGYIEYTELVENGRNKKIYHITSEGNNAFFQWIEAPISEKKTETDILSRVYFLGLVQDKTIRKRIIKNMITKVESITSSLEEYESEIKRIPFDPTYKIVADYQFSTIDYGIRSHKVAIEWLKSLD